MVYFDNAATTQVKKEVLDAMLPVFTENFGNASSTYTTPGIDARRSLTWARQTIAAAFNASEREIYFTAGGSESDNWAIKGYALKNKAKGNHIITTNVEHHAVLHTCQFLEKNGFEVTYVPVDEYGMVHVEDIEKAIKDNTILVTVMFANNEIGTINPIAEIGALCRERKIAFHTDAVQAAGAVPIDVQSMNIDMLSVSGHKLHAPKGIGVLYVKKGLRLDNLIHGGAQESGRRAGTENVPGAVGLATALKLAVDHMEEKTAKLVAMRDKIIDIILAEVPYVRLNGHRTERLPNNVSICFRYIEGESLLLSLDMKGYVVSSGSACTSGSLDPSHVLLGIGLPHEIAHGSMRVTLSDMNTMEEVDSFLAELPPIVKRLRSMSPLFEGVE